MVTAFSVFGLILVIASPVALWLRLTKAEFRVGSPWNGVLAASGIALAAATISISYSPTSTQRIFGFPLPAAAWELRDGRWLDFVGAITPIAYLLNLLIMLLLPQVVAVVVLAIRRRREAA